MAPSLSPFDKERYYSQVDRLLKQINEQSSLKDSKGTKMFQFQKKPKLKERASSVIKNIQDEKKSCAVSNEDVKVKDSTAIYENLNHCTLTTAADMRSSSSGSFILRNATKTLVCLKPPNFQTGSIFISDCANSIILCDTAPNNGIQIRLHNLTDCKLWICPTDSSSKQIVVLENCSKCVFHKSTKERVEIHDFSDLNLINQRSAESLSYEFKTFDIPFCDQNYLDR